MMKFLVLCFVLLSLLPVLTFAGDESDSQFTAADLESFLDSFMPGEMKSMHVPGAVVAIVSNGEVLLIKGYGYADLEQHERIKPNRTLLRMGSISKVFTTVAVLQLAQQGKLRLQDEVNPYLKSFQLQNPFPEPVRIFHLLTHTAGFDERNIGSAVLNEADLTPLGKYLARRMPPVVRPPGDVISYSNHGFTLAGYLVEAVSGMPFAEYIERHILKPLGMSHSSFDPMKEETGEVATGYVYESGKPHPVPRDYFNDGPADGLVSTAPDMARFLLAALNSGQLGNASILKPETMQEMQAMHFTHHPGMPGWCYGFWEVYRNNLRCLIHDGTVFGATSRIYLVPEKNFAFFVSTNIDVTNRGDLTNVVTARLMDYCFAGSRKGPRLEAPDDFAQRLPMYEGTYRHVCYAMRTLEKLELLMGFAPEIEVKAGKNNTLSIESKEFVEKEPLFFEQVTGRSYAAFRQNQAHEITHLFVDQDAFERIAWYQTNRFQLVFAGSCLALLATTCIAWLIRALLRKRPNPLRALYRLSGMIAILHIGFVAIVYRTFLKKRLFEMSYPLPHALKMGLALPLIAVALTLLLLALLARAWKQRAGSLAERLYISLTTTAAVAFLAALNYWNLIGFFY